MRPTPGAFVMTMTPFAADGALDESALRTHLRRLRAAGVGVYVAGSASGEGFSLSPAEVERVLALSIAELKGHVNVRAMGCEVRHAEETLDFLRRIAHHPLDAVHIFPPEMGHATKPSAAELDDYYSTVISATRLPVVLSSYQSFGFELPAAVLERLLQRFPHIIGFFYGGRDVQYLSLMIERFAARIQVHCAGPANALTTLALGGHGFMGHEGNLAPQLAQSVVTSFLNGDRAALRTAFSKLLAIHRTHYRYGGPVRAMKPLLNALGLGGGSLRAPRLAISAADLEVVIEETLVLRIPELEGLSVR